MEALRRIKANTDREAAAERARRAELQHQLLHAQRQGRVRRRDDVCPGASRSAVCRVRRERPAARDLRAAAARGSGVGPDRNYYRSPYIIAATQPRLWRPRFNEVLSIDRCGARRRHHVHRTPARGPVRTGSAATRPAHRPFDALHFRPDRPGIDVGPHRRPRGLRSQPVDLLRRHRARRRLENHQQRHDVRGAVPGPGPDVDRRRRRSRRPIPISSGSARGESNNRQSTSWGDGVYKSTDGGKTYTNMGLRTSRHINRIVIDPREQRRRARRRDRQPVGPGRRARRLQDHRRRPDLEAGAEGRRRHRRQRPRRWIRRTARSSTRRRISGGAPRAA